MLLTLFSPPLSNIKFEPCVTWACFSCSHHPRNPDPHHAWLCPLFLFYFLLFCPAQLKMILPKSFSLYHAYVHHAYAFPPTWPVIWIISVFHNLNSRPHLVTPFHPTPQWPFLSDSAAFLSASHSPGTDTPSTPSHIIFRLFLTTTSFLPTSLWAPQG